MATPASTAHTTITIAQLSKNLRRIKSSLFNRDVRRGAERTYAQDIQSPLYPHKNVTHPQIVLDGHTRKTFRHNDFRVPDGDKSYSENGSGALRLYEKRFEIA